MAARPIKSAERTLALFELFSREQQPFTVGRVSQALDMPQPSASMLLRNLTELGYLEYDRQARTFSPSIRVALLGSWIDRRFGEAASLGARLNALQREVGETAFLGIQNGGSAQYILAQTSEHPERFEVRSGQYRSLTCSAMGRALLCLYGDDEVVSWVRRCNAEADEERFKVRESDFLDLIRRARADGYASSAGDITPGMGAYAMTFTAPMGGMPLAVGLGGAITRVVSKQQSILAALANFTASFSEPPVSRAADVPMIPHTGP